jgi:hypothetical protein
VTRRSTPPQRRTVMPLFICTPGMVRQLDQLGAIPGAVAS